MSFVREEPLTHALAPDYPALRAIRTRKQLLRSDLWARIGGEVERVTHGIERADHATVRGPRENGRLRVVAWNIQRGLQLAGLRQALLHDPVLATADVLLLVEVDHGMGRSGDRNVARELAQALDMNYAFGVSYLVLEDDFGENPEGKPNGLALAGAAILSRVPIGRVVNVDVPELRDKFSSSEKRLGRKRALAAELLLPDGPLAVVTCHLDSNASSAQRARQLAALLDCADALCPTRALVGGDFNTTTYDASSPWGLARDLLHKLFVTGFRGTVDNYLTPDRRYELPVFAVLTERGFTIDGFNDRAAGTIQYDLHSPFAIQKVRKKVGGLLTRVLQRCLRPWGGIVPARLDWFAGRGVTRCFATVVTARDREGRAPSDHAAVVVDLVLGGPPGAKT